MPNLTDITFICNANLINLESLILIDCSIKNIEALENAKFSKIKLINFAINKIGDESIDIISKLNFPFLEELNLFRNEFTDFNFFNFKNNNKSYNNLKTLYIGGNKFNKNYNNKNKYDLSSLEIIGISQITFNDDTIGLIKNFDLQNLKTLYLGKNNLKDTSFFNDLLLPNITKINLNYNCIKNFENLKKYQFIEVIDIKNNEIENIDYLENFISICKNLKKINLTGNKINLNDYINQEIINNIRERGVEIEF